MKPLGISSILSVIIAGVGTIVAVQLISHFAPAIEERTQPVTEPEQEPEPEPEPEPVEKPMEVHEPDVKFDATVNNSRKSSSRYRSLIDMGATAKSSDRILGRRNLTDMERCVLNCMNKDKGKHICECYKECGYPHNVYSMFTECRERYSSLNTR